jgi:hypothetical protein
VLLRPPISGLSEQPSSSSSTAALPTPTSSRCPPCSASSRTRCRLFLKVPQKSSRRSSRGVSGKIRRRDRQRRSCLTIRGCWLTTALRRFVPSRSTHSVNDAHSPLPAQDLRPQDSLPFARRNSTENRRPTLNLQPLPPTDDELDHPLQAPKAPFASEGGRARSNSVDSVLSIHRRAEVRSIPFLRFLFDTDQLLGQTPESMDEHAADAIPHQWVKSTFGRGASFFSPFALPPL